MGEALPKLNLREMARLEHVGFVTASERVTAAADSPASTKRLLDLGLIERIPARYTAGGRVIVWGLRLLPLGIRVLAGFPGDEFDRFRDALRGTTDAP